jgi:prophage regulatory protein
MAKIERSLSIAEAKALAAQWEAQGEDHMRAAAVSACYQHTSPAQVIKMWESGRNEQGQKFSQIEFEGLIERWLILFGSYPPNDAGELNGSAAPQEPEPPTPEDDTMLHMPDVVRMTGLSESSIKRKVSEKTFPSPTKISTRRIGWPAHKIKAWLRQIEQGHAA